MDKISAAEAQKELTIILMYLSRFSERGRLFNSGDSFAWKGYDFNIINELDDEDFIRQGDHPSRTKSVYITDSGVSHAKRLMEKYGISDWE